MKFINFKYQTALKVLLSKQKENSDREFTTVYFNSTAKKVIIMILIIMVSTNLFNKFFIN